MAKIPPEKLQKAYAASQAVWNPTPTQSLRVGLGDRDSLEKFRFETRARPNKLPKSSWINNPDKHAGRGVLVYAVSPGGYIEGREWWSASPYMARHHAIDDCLFFSGFHMSSPALKQGYIACPQSAESDRVWTPENWSRYDDRPGVLFSIRPWIIRMTQPRLFLGSAAARLWDIAEPLIAARQFEFRLRGMIPY